MLNAMLNLLFPPLCRACGEIHEPMRDGARALLCPVCSGKVQKIFEPVCERCGAPAGEEGLKDCPECLGRTYAFDGARSAMVYAFPMREVIHQFKFRGSVRVRPWLIDLFLEGFDAHCAELALDAIAPVPLHWWRLYTREFNQAEILASALAAKLGIPLVTDTLQRARLTLPQSSLDAASRERNIQNAFAPVGDSLRGKRVLLVDDVMTTGGTLSACAAALRKNEPASIFAYTLARGLG